MQREMLPDEGAVRGRYLSLFAWISDIPAHPRDAPAALIGAAACAEPRPARSRNKIVGVSRRANIGVDICPRNGRARRTSRTWRTRRTPLASRTKRTRTARVRKRERAEMAARWR